MKLLQKKGSSLMAMFTAVVFACLGLAQQGEADGFDTPGWSVTPGAYETITNYFFVYNGWSQMCDGFETLGTIGGVYMRVCSDFPAPDLPSSVWVWGVVDIYDNNESLFSVYVNSVQVFYDTWEEYERAVRATHNVVLTQLLSELQSSDIFLGVWDFKKDEDGNILSLRYTLEAPRVTPVDIDIKPGSPENTVNLGSLGVTKVAVMGRDDFDATEVDPLTVELADATVRVKGNGQPLTTIQDTNGDGFLDLVLHVDTEGFSLTDGDVSATLTGSTFGGEDIEGEDIVRVIP